MEQPFGPTSELGTCFCNRRKRFSDIACTECTHSFTAPTNRMTVWSWPINVGAESTLGDKFFARNICIKNQQNGRILHDSCPKIIRIPEFLWHLPEIFFYKIPEFYMIFAREMPEFYIIIAQKYSFPNFRRGGARAHSPPSSPTPMSWPEWLC